MMIRKLLPLLIALLGLGGGVAAGKLFQRPSEAPDQASGESGTEHDVNNTIAESETHAPEDHGESEGSKGNPEAAEDSGDHGEDGPEYVKLNNQFVVPVVKDGRVDALVVLAISLEVGAGNTEVVYQREPKLRDVFLQVMFDHANVGGFSGTFTDGSNLIVLRTNLKEAAAMIMGTVVRDVLITDIARQDS